MHGTVRKGRGGVAQAQRLQCRVMGDPAERHDRAKLRHGRDGRRQELPAGVDLGRQRLVLRRHAAHRVADPAIDQLQSVVGTRLIDAFGKAVFEQGRIEQVAGVVAGERPSGAVGALHARREPDDQQLRVGIAERSHRRIEPVRFSRAWREIRRASGKAGNRGRVGERRGQPCFQSVFERSRPDPGIDGRVETRKKSPGSVSIRTEALARTAILNRRNRRHRPRGAIGGRALQELRGSDDAARAGRGARTDRGRAWIAARRGR